MVIGIRDAELIGNRFRPSGMLARSLKLEAPISNPQMVPDRGLRVKLPPFRDAGRAPHHEMAGSAGGRAGNLSRLGAPRHCRSAEFSANTGSWS